MARVLPFPPYRHEILDHAVPVRIVGPDGRQLKILSQACSRIYLEHGHETGLRWVSAFLYALNAAQPTMPDAADRFVRSVDDCRAVQDRFVKALKIRTRETKDKDGSYWLFPPREIWGKVADATTAICKVTELLAGRVFGGRNPSKVDAALSRTDGRPQALRETRRGLRSDVDRRQRMPENPDRAPRYADPRFWDQWSHGLDLIGASPAFERAGALARHGGGRAFQILGLTLHDVFVRAPEPGRIPAPNKGARGDRNAFEFVLPKSEWTATLEYVGGERARVSGVSLGEIERMAADPRRRHLLEFMPLLTEDGVRPITYDRLYRVMRAAAVRMDLFIDDDAYRCGGRKRFVSFHYLKHEYVHVRMDAADLMTVEERAREHRAIIAYMRWRSGRAMLEWYSAHHLVKRARSRAAEYGHKLDKEVAARSAGRPKPFVSFGCEKVTAMIDGLA